MADISQITIPNGTTYNLRDASAAADMSLSGNTLTLKNKANETIRSVTLPSGGGGGSGGGQAVLLGTDTSGNTSQNSFELSDSLQNYSAIFIMVMFNWANTTNIAYTVTPQVPTAVLPDFTDHGITMLRLIATGTNNYELSLYINYVDDTHISISKNRTTYSFKTLWIYGIR